MCVCIIKCSNIVVLQVGRETGNSIVFRKVSLTRCRWEWPGPVVSVTDGSPISLYPNGQRHRSHRAYRPAMPTSLDCIEGGRAIKGGCMMMMQFDPSSRMLDGSAQLGETLQMPRPNPCPLFLSLSIQCCYQMSPNIERCRPGYGMSSNEGISNTSRTSVHYIFRRCCVSDCCRGYSSSLTLR